MSLLRIALQSKLLLGQRLANQRLVGPMWRLGTLVILLLLVAACSAPTAAPQAATPTDAAASAETPVSTEAAEPKPDEVQELTVGISRNLVNGEQDWIYAHASLQVWEPLIRYDDELKPYPGLAEEWTLSEDGLTWTFKLREGINFSDGAPFNAEAAVASIKRFAQVSGRPSIFLSGINFPEIYGEPTAIEVVDEYTFKIEYATPRPLLPYSISNHYSAILSSTSFGENGDFTGLPIGTGPYKLVDWQRDQYAVLERNENYWGEKPALTKITLKIYPDANSRLSAFKAGEVDALVELGAVLAAQARELANDPNYVVTDHVSACSSQISFNGTKAPFNDARLRQAVSLAVDRDAFVRDLLYGYATPAQSIMISPNTTWLNTDPEAQLRYDLEEAQQLAQEVLGGQRAKVVLAFTPPGEGINAWPFPQIATYLQAILAPLGLDIELKQLEGAALTEARNNGEFDLALTNNCWSAGDPNYILRRLTSSKAALHTTSHGGYNNPEVDALLDEAIVTTDLAKQQALYRQIQAITVVETPLAPLFDQRTIIAAYPYVKGLTQRIAYAPSFETVYIEGRP